MMNRTVPVLFKDKKDCCGCTACMSICPVQAIRMIRDEEGFLYPQINEDLCIRCQQCTSVCPLSSKKAGIVTFNDAYNYGAFLQQYALQKALASLGVQADIIREVNDNTLQQYYYAGNPFKRKARYARRQILRTMIQNPALYRFQRQWRKRFRQCIEEELQFSIPYNHDTAPVIEQAYDLFFAGSDQIWNPEITGEDDFFFLDFVSDPAKKKSYAASFGKTQWEPERVDWFRQRLQTFSDITVREQAGKDMLESTGLKSEVVLDPVFLLNRQQWLTFARRSSIPLPDNYILIYIVMPQHDLLQQARDYATQHHCKIVTILGNNQNPLMHGDDILTFNTDPRDFVHLLAHATKVYTTSFHGLALSLILNTEVVYETWGTDTRTSRLDQIANLTGIQQQNVTGTQPGITWDDVNERLGKAIARSREKLEEMIN